MQSETAENRKMGKEDEFVEVKKLNLFLHIGSAGLVGLVGLLSSGTLTGPK